MSPFTEPQCPRCGGAVPLQKVWSQGIGAWLMLRPKTGVACPSCGEPLVVMQAYAVLVGLISLVALGLLGTAAVVLVEDAIGHKLTDVGRIVVFLLLAGPYVAWQLRVVPRFCRLRPPYQREELYFPLGRTVRRPVRGRSKRTGSL